MFNVSEIDCPAKLLAAANALNEYKEIYETAWSQYYHAYEFGNKDAQLSPLGPARFWEMIPQFNKEIERFCFGYKRTDGIKVATHELFRKAATGESQGAVSERLVTQYDYNDALRFAVTYGLVKRRIQKHIRKLFDYIGDTFGDLTDSLPLAGKEFNAKKFQTEEQLYAEGRQALIPNWSKLIFGGENYIESTLEDAAEEWYLILASQSAGD